MAKKKKASQNEEVANTSEPSTLDGSISNEALARRVIEGVRSAKLTAEDLLELRQRFAKLKKNEDIVGYHRNEWEKFCDEKLGMMPSKARRWIRETCNAIGVPTPGSKHDGSAMRAYQPKKSEGDGDARLPAYNPRAVTPSGYTVATVKSMAIWEIRQGNEKAAGYWMRQLFLAQETVTVDPWRLLHIHVAEEVGLADLGLARVILNLEDLAKRIKDGNTELLPLMLGTALLCRAEKSRLGDNMCIYYKHGPTYVPPVNAEVTAMVEGENPQPQYPPDHDVFDKHTPEGKAMGRGLEHFLQSAKSQLANPSPIPDFQS
jgi:hypothetical protein